MEEYLQTVSVLFESTDVSITCDGKNVLGCPIVTESFIVKQTLSNIDTWTAEIITLTDIVNTHPQAAYSALIYGVFNR